MNLNFLTLISQELIQVKGIEWIASINNRVHGEEEYLYCNDKKAIPGKTSLKFTQPKLMKDWDYSYNSLIIDPEYLMSPKKKLSFYNRKKNSCSYCKGYRGSSSFHLCFNKNQKVLNNSII